MGLGVFEVIINRAPKRLEPPTQELDSMTKMCENTLCGIHGINKTLLWQKKIGNFFRLSKVVIGSAKQSHF